MERPAATAPTILIIDDETDMQIYLGTLFRRAGYRALVAGDGEEGLRVARRERPDLITLDLLMPRRSGVLAYRALRTDETTRHIPVVILTGLPEHRDLVAATSGAVTAPEAVLEKPIERQTFLRIVGEILGG